LKTVIIQYNAGNIRSVDFALQRLGINALVTDNPSDILSADRVIFPGVGEASSAMRYLKSKNLDRLIVDLKQPVLGICLGMQLMCQSSEENNTDCLQIFPNKVKKFSSLDYKVPQIGWNTIYDLKMPLFHGVSENEFVYFVHSFYVEKSEFSTATTRYGFEYTSAMQKDNFFAVQFHPEKSGLTGEKIIQNFLSKTV
jgi:glutamine amidotransferase